MTDEIRFIGDLDRLEIKPGDKFILTAPGPISAQGYAEIQRAWRDFVGGEPDQFKLLILESGIKIEVLEEEIAA